MLVLISIVGSSTLLVQGSESTRLSARPAASASAAKGIKAPVFLVPFASAATAFATVPSAMAATDGGVDLGAIQALAVELPAVLDLPGVPLEAGLAVAGLAVVGGGAFFVSSQEAEKKRRAEEAAEMRRQAEFQAMKVRDNNAGIISMGLPAAVSVGYFIWLVSNFS